MCIYRKCVYRRTSYINVIRLKNTVSNSNSIVVEACLLRSCIATPVVSLFRGLCLASGLYAIIILYTFKSAEYSYVPARYCVGKHHTTIA
jgi:hypothetical protein